MDQETHNFGAEVGRLLDLVVHSLYSEREIFLRELVANAADAMDRRRFEALTDPALAPPEDAAIRVVPDKPARTIRISDDGIGMSRQEMIDNLGTIARSGTRAFGEALAEAKPEDRPSLIGQFGVGFYSAFMVAERVEVTSRKAGSEESFTWASEGGGSFTLTPAERGQAGTDVVLHIRGDAEEFLDPMRLEAIVRKWADHITVPITITRDGKDEKANEGTALWRKPRADVTEQSYKEFYRHPVPQHLDIRSKAGLHRPAGMIRPDYNVHRTNFLDITTNIMLLSRSEAGRFAPGGLRRGISLQFFGEILTEGDEGADDVEQADGSG